MNGIEAVREISNRPLVFGDERLIEARRILLMIEELKDLTGRHSCRYSCGLGFGCGVKWKRMSIDDLTAHLMRARRRAAEKGRRWIF